MGNSKIVELLAWLSTFSTEFHYTVCISILIKIPSGNFYIVKIRVTFYNRGNNSGLWLKFDASCRRNDPRKQEFPEHGAALEVSPAAKSERSSSGERRLRSETSSRRVWGEDQVS